MAKQFIDQFKNAKWYVAENDGMGATIRDRDDILDSDDSEEPRMVCESATPEDAEFIVERANMALTILCPECLGDMGAHIGDTLQIVRSVDCPSCRPCLTEGHRYQMKADGVNRQMHHSCGAYVCLECDDHMGLARCYCGWAKDGPRRRTFLERRRRLLGG